MTRFATNVHTAGKRDSLRFEPSSVTSELAHLPTRLHCFPPTTLGKKMQISVSHALAGREPLLEVPLCDFLR